MEVLQLEHVSRSFRERLVVDDVSFSVSEGEIFGFVGPNGAGKTTTIKMILGLLKPDAGTIRVGGFDLQTQFEQAMGCVSGIVENPDMYNHLSGYENLLLQARACGVDKAAIDEVLELVGMQLRAQDKYGTYSLGMKQRIGVAQALLRGPRVMILDEPTNGLDPAGIAAFRELLLRLSRERGLAALVSSHNLQELQLLCHRVGFIQNGRLIKEAPMSELTTTSARGLYRYTLEPMDRAMALISAHMGDRLADSTATTVDLRLERDEVAVVNARLMENGVTIFGVMPLEASLERSYLDLTRGGDIHA